MGALNNIVHKLIYSRRIDEYARNENLRGLASMIKKPNPTGSAALDRILQLCRPNPNSLREPLQEAGFDPITILETQLIERGDSRFKVSTDPQKRAFAAQALGELGSTRALGALGTALEDADPIVRLSAASALYAMGDDRGRQVLLELAADYQQSLKLRFAALNRFANRGDPVCVMPFVRILVSLIEFDSSEAMVTFRNEHYVPHDREKHEDLTREVAKLIESAGIAGVRELCSALDDSDPRVVYQSVKLLGMVADGANAIESLIELGNRCRAAGKPSSSSTPPPNMFKFVPAHGYGVWFEVDWIYSAVNTALLRIGGEKVDRWWHEFSETADAKEKRVRIDELGRIGNAKAASSLHHFFVRENDVKHRRAALHALSKCKIEESQTQLIALTLFECLIDPDTAIRETAVQWLKKPGISWPFAPDTTQLVEIRARLRSWLRDPDVNVRYHAINSLAVIGLPNDISFLEECAKDLKPSAVPRVNEAINKIRWRSRAS